MYNRILLLCFALCPSFCSADYGIYGGEYYVFEEDGDSLGLCVCPLGNNDLETLNALSKEYTGRYLTLPFSLYQVVSEGVTTDYVCYLQGTTFDSIYVGVINYVNARISSPLVFTPITIWAWTGTPDEVGGGDGLDVEMFTPYVTYYAQCVELCFVGICLFLGVELYIAFMQRY